MVGWWRVGGVLLVGKSVLLGWLVSSFLVFLSSFEYVFHHYGGSEYKMVGWKYIGFGVVKVD